METTALVLGNNPHLEEEIIKFLKTKEIKIQPIKAALTPVARYNIFVLNPNNSSQDNLNQLIDILHQGTSQHKFILIVQKSNLNSQNKTQSSKEIFSQLTKERNLDARVVDLWDLVSINPSSQLSSLDKLLKQSLITTSINISQDNSLQLFPLDLPDFLRALAKIIFTQKSTNPHYTLAGPKYSDIDLALLFKQHLQKNNIKLEVDQDLDTASSSYDPQDDADNTAGRINWLSQVDPEQVFASLSKFANSSITYPTSPPPKKSFVTDNIQTPSPSPKKITDGSIKRVEITWFLKVFSLFTLSSIILVSLVTAVFLFFINTSITKLNFATSAIKTQEFNKVPSLVNSSQRRLDLAQVIYTPLSPLVNLFSPELGTNLSSLFNLLHYSQNITNQTYSVKSIAQSTYSDSINNQELDLKQVSASLISSLQLLQSQINQLLHTSSLTTKMPLISSLQAFTDGEALTAQTSSATSLAQALPFLLPSSQISNFIVLVQDNNEYRPSGGFFNSYVSLTFTSNRLIDAKADSSLNLAGKIEGIITPPQTLSRLTGDGNWQIHDANFYANFPDSAKQIVWFWEKTTSRPVDTVIAVNLSFIKDILKETGPITISNDVEVTADNLELLLLSPTLNQDTDTLTQVVKQLTDQLKNKQLPFAAISQAFINGLTSSDIYLYSNNEKAQSLIQNTSFSGIIAPPVCPAQFSLNNCLSLFVHVNEANFAVNKSNFYQHRDINHKIDIKLDGTFSHLIEVDYSYPTPVPNLSSSIYQSLINLYLPASYQISQIALDNQPLNEEEVTIQTNQQINQITFPVSFTLNQNHKLAISAISTIPLDITGQATSLSLYTIKQAGSQNTNQQVEITYQDNLFPKIISLPFSQSANSIIFDKLPSTSTFYAINFLLRN